MKAEAPLIISRPERQRTGQRWLFRLLTALLWGLWLSLWRPIAALAAHALGWSAPAAALGWSSSQSVGSDWLQVLQVAAVALTAMVGWSLYNRWRFTGRQRRRTTIVVSRAEMAAALGATEETAAALARARRVVVAVSDAGVMTVS